MNHGKRVSEKGTKMDINNLEKFKEKVASGKTAVGCCITFAEASISEVVADAGADFIWIDMEHGAMVLTDVLGHLMAIRGTDCAPFVRVPWNEHGIIKPVLDLAPAGVIIPMVNSKEIAEAAVAACKYPPRGTRGCGIRRAARYGVRSLDEYLKLAEKDPMVIVQIEHIDAVRNLDAILKVPGVDSVCIGPFDLSASMGKLGQINDPEVAKVLDEVCYKTRKAGVMLGAFGTDYRLWRGRGVQWTALGSDSGFLFGGVRNAILACKD